MNSDATEKRMTNLQKAWKVNKEKQQKLQEQRLKEQTRIKEIEIKEAKEIPITGMETQNTINTRDITVAVEVPKEKKQKVNKYWQYVLELGKDLFYYILYAIIFYIGGVYLESARNYYQLGPKSVSPRSTNVASSESKPMPPDKSNQNVPNNHNVVPTFVSTDLFK